jgi:polysaccharide export outer membrane protein
VDPLHQRANQETEFNEVVSVVSWRVSVFRFGQVLTWLSAGLLLAPAAPAQAQTPRHEPAGAPSAEYRIGAGDVLQLFVWREADISRELPVRIDGRVSVPLLGDVQAAGRTTTELAAELTRLFSRFLTSPQVTVGIARANSARFFVLGQVTRPGEFPLTGRTTVLQALAMAGGFKDFAKTDSIVIVRQEEGPSGPAGPGQTFIGFNYKRLEGGKDATQNLLLQAGDTILVP